MNFQIKVRHPEQRSEVEGLSKNQRALKHYAPVSAVLREKMDQPKGAAA